MARTRFGAVVMAAAVMLAAGGPAGAAGKVEKVEKVGAPAQASERVRLGQGLVGRAAVAADHALASKAGAEILAAGGNAVDAAVATSFALSVVRPFSCGIGGGGFLVIHLPARAGKPEVTVAINYRETGGSGLAADSFTRPGVPARASTLGGAAVAVPGTVAGLLLALERYGTMERAAVLAPAIALAERGFAADEAYVKASREAIGKVRSVEGGEALFSGAWEVFLGRGEVKVGDVIRPAGQARALRAIAEKGVAGFNSGEVGEAIIRAVRADAASPGTITPADLAGYTPKVETPLSVEFAGGWQGKGMERRLLLMPPPSSGGIAIGQVFGLLAERGVPGQISGGEITSPTQRQYLFELAEAFKLAFADRAVFLADPAFANVPTERLLSGAWLKQRAAVIRGFRTGGAERYVPRGAGGEGGEGGEGGVEGVEDGGTSHLSVVDQWGGAVACTETINLEFGSLLVPRLADGTDLGFCLNNQVDDFSTRPGEANAFGLKQSTANAPGPGKRPLSSMSPTIGLRRKTGAAQWEVEVVVGASGGPRIITATAQTLANVLLFGRGVVEAVEGPRIHHQWQPNVLRVDGRMEADGVRDEGMRVVDWLRKMGHQVERLSGEAAVQAVVRGVGGEQPEGGVGVSGASDSRKGGVPGVVGER
jgi:gamma-glutamyltranspeptidase/glutathione hydrolase